MESRKPYLATLPGLILGCLVCCALWGSAFPCIKIGYSLFGIPAHDSASQLFFAGLRFTLAGVLVIIGMSAAQRRLLVPQVRDIKPICILSLFQTVGQYFFFYLGLSRASAMSSSIIEASANFLAILFAALAFRTEKLNAPKVLGCVLGFTGVALVNLSGADGTFGFTLDGEGRFVANDEVLAQLIANGQVATQYVGEDGKPSMDLSVNPNGSALAIEGITSPDGRVLGKMGHAERRGDNLYRNVPEHVPGDKFMPIFESGVAYFA